MRETGVSEEAQTPSDLDQRPHSQLTCKIHNAALNSFKLKNIVSIRIGVTTSIKWHQI